MEGSLPHLYVVCFCHRMLTFSICLESVPPSLFLFSQLCLW